MSGIFLKFRRRLNLIRTIRAALVGVSSGMAAAGVWLILSKSNIIEPEPITALYIGIGLALIVGGLFFLFGGKSSAALARELDSKFGLKARVQTMIAYEGEEGELISVQREDAEATLSKIPPRAYKFKRLWLYLLIFALTAGILVGGFMVENIRDYVPPEEVIPFELSDIQRAGLNELIAHVERSEMEEEFKRPMVEELRGLLDTLTVTYTQKEMLIAVSGSMEELQRITYASSTSTEMLNALWDSDNLYFKHLAKTLDTSTWSAPSWSDFAEALKKYEGVLMGDDKLDADGPAEGDVVGKALLKFALESMSLTLNITLDSSALPEEDEIYTAIVQLFNSEGGFVPLLAELDSLDEDGARAALTACFDANGRGLFDAISFNKVNANEGEYAMMRLAGLFVVPIPEFERPEFVKNGESIGGKDNLDDDENNNANADGGVGEGATYGSNDMVLDPLTGEYVEYGKLLDKYYAIMYERLEGDSYTEEQKEAIRKYFGLLYSGIEK